MSDEPVSHQDVEKYCEELPLGILDRLPMSNEKEQARAHVREAAKLAHGLVEGAEDAEKQRTTAFRAAQEAGVAWLAMAQDDEQTTYASSAD